MSGRFRRGFWHDGQRYELREWFDPPTAEERKAGMSVVRSEPQARWVLGAAMRNTGPFEGFGGPALPSWGLEPHVPSERARVDRILEELRLGRRLLVTIDTRLPVDHLARWDEGIVDLADLAQPEPQEDTWVEFVFEYPDGTKVSGLKYVLVDPFEKETPGTLAQNGTITRRGVAPGDYTVVLEEIEHAVWEKSRARCDDELKVIARCSGYPDGTPATVKLYRERIESEGDEIATVEAKVQGDVIEATLQYDDTADEDSENETGVIGLIAEVSLDGGKVWEKTQRALQLQLKTLRSVQWSRPSAALGDTVDIVVEALGYPPGTQVSLELWKLDWIEGDAKVCDIGPIPLSGDKAVARCAYAGPDAAAGADATIEACGEYYVVAEIEGSVVRTARSDLLWCAFAETEESEAESAPESDTRAA